MREGIDDSLKTARERAKAAELVEKEGQEVTRPVETANIEER
jgi:hypothetical protein